MESGSHDGDLVGPWVTLWVCSCASCGHLPLASLHQSVITTVWERVLRCQPHPMPLLERPQQLC